MHKNFLKELNRIIALHLRFDFINAPNKFYFSFCYPLVSIERNVKRDLFAKHPLDRRCRCREELAWSAACVYACKFATLLLSTNGAPACRSSAWDVVRQKAVKRRGPRRSGPSYPRPLACKNPHTRARAYTHELSRARSLRLFASDRHPLFKAPLVVPRHRLKRHSAKIIKGGPASRGPIDPVNSVTTTTLASLKRRKRVPASLRLACVRSSLCLVSHDRRTPTGPLAF